MAKKKPAALRSDTGPPAGDTPPGVLQDATRHESAKNPESLDSPTPEIRQIHVSVIAARPHPVIFTVIQNGNAICFLSDLLINLQLVDSTATILPHSEADSSLLPLLRSKDIPSNASASFFAKAYLANSKIASKGDMKGHKPISPT